MGKLSSKSDYIVGSASNYAQGIGYYATHTDVSDLLQCGAFTSSTTPDISAIGKIIKRIEGKIDDKLKVSHRPEIIEKEVHDFDPFNQAAYPVQPWKDYVGFVQLHSEKVRKLLRLEVWQGNGFIDMASATCIYTPPTTAQTGTYTLRFDIGSPVTVSFTLTENTANGFYDQFGQKTTVLEICAAINEKYPSQTAQFTQQNSQKTTAASTGSGNISNFFYACPTNDGKSVYISSKLPADAGTICNLVETLGSTATTISFTDNENKGRTEEFWTIDDEGKIFFRTNYPYQTKHSIRVAYIRGGNRIPAAIHEAAIKLVAAEVLLTDDNTILIAETGNIDVMKKHEILVAEANAILEGKRNLVHLID
tara:strand:+ start:15199 stop:16293 length:1095 start_codon:yes stop_codon:yes gene_type:complete